MRSNLLGSAPDLSFPVTDEIIKTSCQRNSSHCMVAEALRARKPKLKHISVDIQTIRATDSEKNERYIWITPRAIQQMIVDFDRGKRPKAFNVKLRAGQTIETERKSNAEKKYLREYYHENKNKRAKIVKNKSSRSSLPQVVGGKAPPRSIASRREFGLRGIKA